MLPKLDRMFHLVLLLQNRERLGAGALAERLGVTTRTVYRDVEALRAMGVPCEYDRKQEGYRLGREFFLPPLDFTAGEALALVAVVSRVAADDRFVLTGPALSAMEKIRARLPDGVTGSLDDLDRHIDIRLPPSGPGDEVRDVFEKVRCALRERRVLDCRYISLNHPEGTVFDLHPYGLAFEQRAWYVIGYHGGHEAVRRLKLGRFDSVAQTGRKYTVPRDFSLASFRGKAWRMIRGERLERVKIVFDPVMAETVAETRWHETQEVESREDGSILFRCEVEGLEEIVWWILGYGPHARVLEPPALVERIAGMARAMAGQYEEKR